MKSYRRRPGENAVDDVIFNELDLFGAGATELVKQINEEFGEVGYERMQQLCQTKQFQELHWQGKQIEFKIVNLLTDVWNALYKERKQQEP